MLLDFNIRIHKYYVDFIGLFFPNKNSTVLSLENSSFHFIILVRIYIFYKKFYRSILSKLIRTVDQREVLTQLTISENHLKF